jgi:hypothetical protein
VTAAGRFDRMVELSRTPVGRGMPRRARNIMIAYLALSALLAAPLPLGDKPHEPNAIELDGATFDGEWLVVSVRSGARPLVREIGVEVFGVNPPSLIGKQLLEARYGPDLAQQRRGVLHAWAWTNQITTGVQVPVGTMIVDAPRSSALHSGDIVWARDGVPHPVPLRALTQPATFTVLRGGAHIEVQVGPDDPALQSIGMLAPAVTPEVVPFLGAGSMGGSSGLSVALALIDAATDGSLSAGKRIAATGTATWVPRHERGPELRVGEIGGLDHKLTSVERYGADVFFIPVENLDAVTRAQIATMTTPVVAVSSVWDAIGWLCDNGATSQLCASLG